MLSPLSPLSPHSPLCPLSPLSPLHSYQTEFNGNENYMAIIMYDGMNLMMIHYCGESCRLLGCSVPELVFTLYLLKTVVEVKAYGPPHVLKRSF